MAKQKSEFQLSDHFTHLRNDLGVSEEDVARIQMMVLWPNLSKVRNIFEIHLDDSKQLLSGKV